MYAPNAFFDCIDCGMNFCIRCLYKHTQQFHDLSRSSIEDLQDAEMQAEEDMFHMRIACALDPAKLQNMKAAYPS